MSMSCLDAAERVLREAGKPLHYEEITERALAANLWFTSGKTPAATVNARLCDDMKRYGDRSRFERSGPGVFNLRGAGSPSTASPVSKPAPAASKPTPTARPRLDGLESEIKKIRVDFTDSSGRPKKLNESKTRSFLVEPILKRLGWDSPDVMEPEYPVGGRQRVKVDVALLRREKIEVMVEVKPGKLSESHSKQLQEYCRLDDVSLGC